MRGEIWKEEKNEVKGGVSGMGRANRIWYPGATYHVIARGNRQQEIFRDTEDRQVFLQKIGWVKSKNSFKLHAYVLMTNHYHLLLETSNVDVAEIMRDLNGFYTRSFNKKCGFIGHLFQGRYRSILVEKEVYLLEVSRYIHLNPVRAGIVKRPEDFRWTSFRAYLGKYDPLRDCDKVLELVDGKDPVNQYRDFVYEQLGVPDYTLEDRIADGDILGSPGFVREKHEL